MIENKELRNKDWNKRTAKNNLYYIKNIDRLVVALVCLSSLSNASIRSARNNNKTKASKLTLF